MTKIDDVIIKEPDTMDFEDYTLTKSGRVASGLMKADIIASKRKFNLMYAVLSGNELKKIRDLLFGSNKFFFTLSYIENNEEKTATVYPGALKRRKFRTDGVWYWKDVEISLIEQ